MTTRGDLLALIARAPGPLCTLQGALATWMHLERAAAAVARAEADPADDAALAHVASEIEVGDVVDLRAGFDALTGLDDLTDLDDLDEVVEAEPLGGDAARDADAAASLDMPHWPPPRPGWADDGPEVHHGWYLSVALPDRWRVVGRGQVAVSDGERSWAGTSTLVTERDSSRAAIHDAGVIGALLYPAGLLGDHDFAEPAEDEVEGRRCWVVDARPRPDASGASARPPASLALRLHRDLVGVDHRLWFDAATGILLRHEGSIDGEMCAVTELTDLVFDARLPAEEFRPPPSAVVRPRHELLRDHLLDMGVDPDEVDLDDPAQVRAALRSGPR
jgi:hypothetical protein